MDRDGFTPALFRPPEELPRPPGASPGGPQLRLSSWLPSPWPACSAPFSSPRRPPFPTWPAAASLQAGNPGSARTPWAGISSP